MLLTFLFLLGLYLLLCTSQPSTPAPQLPAPQSIAQGYNFQPCCSGFDNFRSYAPTPTSTQAPMSANEVIDTLNWLHTLCLQETTTTNSVEQSTTDANIPELPELPELPQNVLTMVDRLLTSANTSSHSFPIEELSATYDKLLQGAIEPPTTPKMGVESPNDSWTCKQLTQYLKALGCPKIPRKKSELLALAYSY